MNDAKLANVPDSIKIWLGALAILMVPLFIAALIPFSLMNAWVAQKLYGWFVLPLHAPQLNFWEVWGLCLLITHLTVSTASDNKKFSKRKFFGSLLGHVIGWGLVLLLGLIIKTHVQVSW